MKTKSMIQVSKLRSAADLILEAAERTKAGGEPILAMKLFAIARDLELKRESANVSP